MSSFKILTFKRDFAAGVYLDLRTEDTVIHVGIFDQFCELWPPPPSPFFANPPPFPVGLTFLLNPNGGGGGRVEYGVIGGEGRGPQTDKTPATKPP